MNGHSDIAWSRQLSGTSVGQVIIWTLAALIMLTAHAGATWWAMRESPAEAGDEPAAAIMIDLASIPMAPEAAEEQIAMDEVDAVAAEPAEQADTAEPMETVEAVPPEEMMEPVEETAEIVEPMEEEMVEVAMAEEIEPEIVEPIEEIIEPRSDAVIPIPQARPEPVKPREVAQKKPREKAKPKPAAPSRSATRAQTTNAQPAPRAAAAQVSAGSGASVSPARWQARVAAHLERRKRYPSSARQAGKQGTVQVRFSIDANGNVQSVSLVRTSGVQELDDEVVSLVRRASPVPAPPPGAGRTIVVPIRFSLR